MERVLDHFECPSRRNFKRRWETISQYPFQQIEASHVQMKAAYLFTALLLLVEKNRCLSLTSIQNLRRRELFSGSALTIFGVPTPAFALSLRDAMASRDASMLKKPIFNTPPAQTAYPMWMEGNWQCVESFRGFELPSKKISKARVVSDTSLPGFTKLSIVRFGDVGKSNVAYEQSFESDSSGTVRESYAPNVARSIVAHTGDPGLVFGVEYVAAKNPNRATINLRAGRNGQRIEIFVNSRRAEGLSDDIFLCSESVRQVTLGEPTLQDPTVARQVIGEYQHYWTWRRGKDGGTLTANCLTAAYVEPQDAAMFSDALDQPVVVYSHNLTLTKKRI